MTDYRSPIAGDVVSSEPLGPGVYVHRHRQVAVTEPNRWGKPERTFVAWPRCISLPLEEGPASTHWRQVSYDWAVARGAELCTAEQCFP
jgi:hypothetical protein